MAKYMLTANYSSDGMKGLLADGGSGRKAAVESLVVSFGGSVEAMYFSLGNHDVVLIVDGGAQSALDTTVLTIASTGAFTSYNAIPLSTPEEIDAAAKKSPAYRAPGA